MASEQDPYWELCSDDESTAAGNSAIPSSCPSSARGSPKSLVGEPSLAALAEDLDAASLVREFARAVVPLSGFIVLYLGLLLERWILTWDMVGGLICVVVGLAFFKYGLVGGLMPLGESIGQGLPRKTPASLACLTSLLLGILATFSEPGIGSLQLVGEVLHLHTAGAQGSGRPVGTASAADALLLRLLSPARSFQLLLAVASGVGVASPCGLLRLQYQWGMKPLIFCIVVPLLILTSLCWSSEELSGTVGLCWDCGAITTGPATVPIMLSLGVGASRASLSARRQSPCSSSGSELDGFGIVTLASLVPVLTVMLFAYLLGGADDGVLDKEGPGELPDAAAAPVQGAWVGLPVEQLWQSCRAVGPLVAFLVLVQAFLIREKLEGVWSLVKGATAAFLGLFIFGIGLTHGSVPLGDVSGQTLPRALDSDTLLSRWGLVERGSGFGQFAVMAFGFVAGFVSTVIDLEPCGLGETVERFSGGRFTKRDLVMSVAFGVGVGTVLGIAKVIWQLNLLLVLIVGYALALTLTVFVDEGLCCIAWDSAGVTTGPVTVPLVLSLGVGICGHIGSTDGFGILACASVCPIVSVLAVALVRSSTWGRRQTRCERQLSMHGHRASKEELSVLATGLHERLELVVC